MFPSKIFPKIRRKYCDEDLYSLLRKDTDHFLRDCQSSNRSSLGHCIQTYFNLRLGTCIRI
ncbi:hypothetical protein ARMSODRAFT_614255 [Armillaria solidipes]|uniref:Uncharacterized protein n=1 Tax=Armillaria solidipes TaxID=1076256 RepID=A0A2H3ATK3_9AGAR|nr:hypothetical protein ARMSODRAFT_614255 [Armillaria solidipes]